MKYYILNNDKNKTGVPVLLNAVLAEEFNPQNPMPPMVGYSWCCAYRNERIYPDELYLISKDRLYTFDYIRFWDGYVVSSEFLELIKSFSSFRYNIVKLNVIGWKGVKITDKKYYFIEIPISEWIDAIDFEKSVFMLDDYMLELKGLNKEQVIAEKNYFTNIKAYKSIHIDSSRCKNNQIFQVRDNIIQDLICSQEVFFLVRTLFVDDGSSRFRVPIVGVYVQLAAELHLITVHRDAHHNYYMTVFLRFVLL